MTKFDVEVSITPRLHLSSFSLSRNFFFFGFDESVWALTSIFMRGLNKVLTRLLTRVFMRVLTRVFTRVL